MQQVLVIITRVRLCSHIWSNVVLFSSHSLKWSPCVCNISPNEKKKFFLNKQKIKPTGLPIYSLKIHETLTNETKNNEYHKKNYLFFSKCVSFSSSNVLFLKKYKNNIHVRKKILKII